jgi:hypothetical protein
LLQCQRCGCRRAPQRRSGRRGFSVWSGLLSSGLAAGDTRRILARLSQTDTFMALFAADSVSCQWQSAEVALAVAGLDHNIDDSWR